MITTTLKTVNYYYLTKYAQGIELGTEDSLALAPIALQTPYLGGDAVFGARVMLGIDPDDYGIAYKGELDMGQEVTQAYRVYPNPTSDDLQIDLFESSFTAHSKIILLDLTGRIVWQSKNAVGGRSTKISLAGLGSGVYVLRVMEGEQALLTERIIINR
jgi:hypothetical protein